MTLQELLAQAQASDPETDPNFLAKWAAVNAEQSKPLNPNFDPKTLQHGTGMAINPATGKMEQVYAIPPSDSQGDHSDYRFASDGLTPQHASLAGYAPGYYSGNDSVLGGLGDILSNPANALWALTTGQTGGMTGAQALTGGDVGKGVVQDIAGLGAGVGLAQALPALGLSTPAATAAAGGTAAAGSAGGAAAGAGGEAAATALPVSATPTLAELGATSLPPLQTAAAGGGGVGALEAAAATAAGGAAANNLMPAATPPVDPTHGGDLTQTGTGQYENLGGDLTAPAANGAGNAVGRAAAGTPLGRLLGLDSGTADLVSVLGSLGATGLGAYGANQQANAMRGIYDDMAKRRQPFLDKSLGYLNDPTSYATGPGAASLDAVLRRLSVGGNPVGDPGKLEIATQAGLTDWRNAVTGFGNMGLSGEDTRANVATGAVNADANTLNAIGSGLYDITQPRRKSLGDYLSSLA